MKIINLFLMLCVASFAYAAKEPNPTKPYLVVLIMVKDESQVIVPTLTTYLPKNVLEGKADTGEVAYVLYDTGSTDGTETIAQEFFEKNKIKNYLIAQEPFVDFATSRNKALAIARKEYPDSTFILFPDAEWYFHNFDALLEFCKKQISSYSRGEQYPPAYYRITMKLGKSSMLTPRLILTKDDVEFEGDVHECTTKCSSESVPHSLCFIEVGRSRFGYEKSKARWVRDKVKLLKRHNENPQDPRAVYYLARTEMWLGEYLNAYEYMKRRTKLSSFEQEDYSAWYELGQITEFLSTQFPESYSWEEALTYYHHAYNMRPHRAEALVRIAAHYENTGNHALSYIYAKRAADLPLPSPEAEILAISVDDYEYQRWEILSRCAWYVQDYDLGEKAVKNAIEAQPNNTHLYRNLSYYWERTK